MRALILLLSAVMLVALLAACSTRAEDDDDTGAADPTETPVMDSQQTDDSDDAVADDSEATDDSADDSVSDDSATDDAADDATDDATDDSADDATTDDDEVEAPEPAEHTIEMLEGNEFSPAEITIAVGDTVTWMNVSDQVHTVSADPDIATDPSHVQLPDGAEPFHSGGIDPDESFSMTFDVPGTYIYFCYPHQDGGMLGTIIVEDPNDTEADDPSGTDADTDVDHEADDAEDTETEAEGEGTAETGADTTPSQRQYTGKDSTN
jgi:plastocyanin